MNVFEYDLRGVKGNENKFHYKGGKNDEQSI